MSNTISTPINFSVMLNGVREMAISAIINLLESRNLTEVDLVRYHADEFHLRIHAEKSSRFLPFDSCCDNGDYDTCEVYKLKKKHGVWCALWSNDYYYEDYYAQHETEEDYKGRPHFQTIFKVEDIVKVYDRLNAIFSNPSILDEEERKYNERWGKGA